MYFFLLILIYMVMSQILLGSNNWRKLSDKHVKTTKFCLYNKLSHVTSENIQNPFEIFCIKIYIRPTINSCDSINLSCQHIKYVSFKNNFQFKTLITYHQLYFLVVLHCIFFKYLCTVKFGCDKIMFGYVQNSYDFTFVESS